MTEELHNHFSQYIPVSKELQQELDIRLREVLFKKGALLHNANTICTKSYFILEGLTRTFYIKDEKEITEYFSAEGEWVNSPRSFTQQKKDIYFIEALEPTRTVCIEVHDLVYLFDHFPEMERYARLSMGTVFGHFMDRVTSLRFTTAKEKYDHFCETYADVYHRIPLGMIASYLGITQETLSRVRAEK